MLGRGSRKGAQKRKQQYSKNALYTPIECFVLTRSAPARKAPSELSPCQRQRACQFLDNRSVYRIFMPCPNAADYQQRKRNLLAGCVGSSLPWEGGQSGKVSKPVNSFNLTGMGTNLVRKNFGTSVRM